MSLNEPSDFDKLKEKLMGHEEKFVEPPLKRQKTETTKLDNENRINFFKLSNNP